MGNDDNSNQQEPKQDQQEPKQEPQQDPQAQQQIQQQQNDNAEINRKIDGLLDAVGILGKQVAQLSADYGRPTNNTTQVDMTKQRPDPDDKELEDMDFSL